VVEVYGPYPLNPYKTKKQRYLAMAGRGLWTSTRLIVSLLVGLVHETHNEIIVISIGRKTVPAKVQ
jgi:exosome complex RNA-binding protein Rrp4